MPGRRLVTVLIAVLVLGAGCSSDAETVTDGDLPLAQATSVAETVTTPTTEPPEPTPTSLPEATPTVPPPVATPTPPLLDLPEPEPGEILLIPDGPYVEGDTVQLVLNSSQEIDVNYGGPLFCARVDDGEEFCDPQVSTGRTNRAAGAVTATVPVSRFHFGPTGHQDCGQANVTCRFLFLSGRDGLEASPTLAYDGAAEPPVELAVRPMDPPGTFTLSSAVDSADPAAFLTDADLANIAGLLPTMTVSGRLAFDPTKLQLSWRLGSLCGFGAGTAPVGSDILDEAPQWWGILDATTSRTTTDGSRPTIGSNCDWQAIPRDLVITDPREPIQLELPRDIYGYHGWLDCADVACFISLQVQWMYPEPGGGTIGSDLPVAYALIEPPDNWPEVERPSITITTPPPYEPGQTITVEGRNLRGATDVFAIGFCIGTGNCRYGPDYSVTDGVITLTQVIPATGCVPNRCYFAISSGDEGQPPPAIAVIPLPS